MLASRAAVVGWINDAAQPINKIEQRQNGPFLFPVTCRACLLGRHYSVMPWCRVAVIPAVLYFGDWWFSFSIKRETVSVTVCLSSIPSSLHIGYKNSKRPVSDFTWHVIEELRQIINTMRKGLRLVSCMLHPVRISGITYFPTLDLSFSRSFPSYNTNLRYSPVPLESSHLGSTLWPH